MKSNIPWSVKGIDPEAREAAKVAARRAGMTLGEWLNSLILQSGDVPPGMAEFAAEVAAEEAREAGQRRPEAAVQPSPPSAWTTSAEPMNALQSKLETLNRRLDVSERQSALAVSGIDQSIERLASTIEGSRRSLQGGEMPARAALQEISGRLERMSHRIEEVAAHGRSGLDPRTLHALEKAIQGVASHIEKSDVRNTELVQSVEAALGELGAKVEAVEESAADAIGRIELAVDRVSGRVDAAESEHRRTSARLNERLAQIDERIVGANSQLDTKLGAIERRMSQAELRAEAAHQELAKGGRAAPDATNRRDLDDLSRSLFVAQESDRTEARKLFAGLDERLKTIADRVDRVSRDSEAVHERRANEEATTRRTSEALLDASEQRTAKGLADLRSVVEDLVQRTERTNQTATAAMSALEQVTRALSGRIDALERRAPGAPAAEPMMAAPAVEEKAVKAAPPIEEDATPWWGRNRRKREEDDDILVAPAEDPHQSAIAPETETRVSDEEVVEFAASPEEAAAEPEDDWRDERRAEVSIADDQVRDEAERPRAWFEREPDDIVEIVEAGEPIETPFDRERTEAIEEQEKAEESDRRDVVAGAEAVSGRTADAFPNLRSLRLNLKDNETREEAAGEEEEPRAVFGRAEPRFREGAGAEPQQDDYLEQARRAALAAGASERTSQAARDESAGRSRGWIFAVLGLLLLIALMALAYLFLWPMIQKQMADRPAADAGISSPAPANTDAGDPSAVLSDLDALAERDGTAPPTDGATPAAGEADAPSTEQPEEPAGAPAAAASPEAAMQAAAEGGDARAQFALARAYQTGSGLDQDAAKAAEWMRKAAEQGVAAAQYRLGVMLESGQGIAENMREARLQYEKAARGGNVRAMHNLAVFHYEGRGGLKSDGVQAERWFREAAELGLTDSQVNLAILKHSGGAIGVEQSLVDAYFWYAVAAQSGDPDATQQRDSIIDLLSSAQRSEVDERLQAWKPKRISLEANEGFDISAEAFLPSAERKALTTTELVRLEEGLAALGYSSGIADGKVDGTTSEAIRAFQKDYGLPVDGIADRDILQALSVAPR